MYAIRSYYVALLALLAVSQFLFLDKRVHYR